MCEIRLVVAETWSGSVVSHNSVTSSKTMSGTQASAYLCPIPRDRGIGSYDTLKKMGVRHTNVVIEADEGTNEL